MFFFNLHDCTFNVTQEKSILLNAENRTQKHMRRKEKEIIRQYCFRRPLTLNILVIQNYTTYHDANRPRALGSYIWNDLPYYIK